jgi:hypothetical protein
MVASTCNLSTWEVDIGGWECYKPAWSTRVFEASLGYIARLYLKKKVFSKVKRLYLFIFYSFIHMCIHCLGHFSPLPPAPPPPSPSHLPLMPGRICSPLISNFVEEKV